jgi:hypothetical protein
MWPTQPSGFMGSKFCGEIVSEGFRSHLSVEKVEEVEKVEGVNQ